MGCLVEDPEGGVCTGDYGGKIQEITLTFPKFDTYLTTASLWYHFHDFTKAIPNTFFAR